jgi:rare lipoprotein A
MSSISCDGSAATLTVPDAANVSFAGFWKDFRLFAVGLTAVTLAACAQSSVSSNKSALAPSRQASMESHTNRHAAVATTGPAPSATDKRAKEAGDASYGLASIYGNESQTASGERFNPDELTAAHRTLPFGTRVRVTNHINGRSVVVVINDRGPFVRGRIIDVTPAGARALGLSGLAPVTVERE